MNRIQFNSIYTVSLLVLLLSLSTPAQGQDAILRWNNGDVLPGRLLQSESGQVRWSSAIFSDDLLVDHQALESIGFPKQAGHATEAFRVGTVSGDVFVADLVGSDDNSLVFSSKRLGKLRVDRDTIYSLNRLSSPNLAFDGSQYQNWDLALDGPIKDLTYRVYDINEDWERSDPFPDLSKLTPAREGGLAAGYLDLGLSGFPDVVSAGLHFAMVFEGQLKVSQAGQYRFRLYADDQARLFINGRPVVEFLENGRNPAAGGHTGVVTLDRGFHSLRVEFLELGGEFKLVAGVTGPDDKSQSLVGVNKTSGWRRGPGGHMQSHRKQAGIFTEIEIPEQFEIDVELYSSASPRFALAFGRDKLSAALNEALRVETWGDELVVVQDKVFEPVMTIPKDQYNVRLRLAYASDLRELRVYDASGRALVKVKDVQPSTGKSGIFIRNRGEDLTVQRLSVYRPSGTGAREVFDSAKPRVHMIDGQVVYGRLHVADGAAHAVDQDGTRHNIDLDQVDRSASPGAKLAVTVKVAELSYVDGAILRGRVEQVNSDQLMLRTAFSDTPVPCALAGAVLLRFNSPAAETTAPDDDVDQLFMASGRLRGRLSFDISGSPLGWWPQGAARPLRLARAGAGCVERRSQAVTKGPSFDTDRFPYVLHLKNGEIIPCRISSYDISTLGFESPFVKQLKIDTLHVKAIEFTPRTRRDAQGKSSSRADHWLRDIMPEHESSHDIEPTMLKRALTVPRFRRDTPHSHILMAKNGDLKRGKLLGLNTQTIQFESKLRKQNIPLAQMARVVNVSKSEQDPNQVPEPTIDLTGKVRVSLADGTIMIFTALEFRDGKLIGNSAIYGDVTIPTESIRELNIGDFEKAPFKSLFEDWVIRPAREPAFGDSKEQ